MTDVILHKRKMITGYEASRALNNDPTVQLYPYSMWRMRKTIQIANNV